jgi:arylsulfatase A-like enzyme/Tfp pilus assembly protein PilF
MGCRPAVVLSLCFALAASAFGQRASSPDVYLITIDTLRADHVGAYGDKQALTPTLDALARQGIRFEQAFTPSPITNTSHASILTGLLPSSHGVTDFAVPLPADKPTIAATLRAAGYHTGAFIGAVILDSKTLAPGLDRGFDFYYDFPPAAQQVKSRYGRVERRGMDVVRRAEQWLAVTKGPRFAWVHLYDPHDPYDPPAPYATQFRDRPYDGEIAYADHALGAFIAFLKQRRMYENAVIIVVGDHGEGLGEHGEDTHGIFLYDSTLHVPLIIRLPHDVSAGKTVAAQARTIDIAPTIAGLLQLPPAAKLDGAPLQPLWSEGREEERVALGETDYPMRFGWAPLRSVRADGSKYIEAPRSEFYDLKADPGETKNIYEPWAAKTQKLREILASANLRRADEAAAVPASTAAELKALGYFPEVRGETTATAPSLLPDPKDKIGEQNLLHRAMLADEDGDPQAARAALEQALAADPRSPSALLQLGQLELREKHSPRAAELLERACAVRPTDAGAAWYLGQALYATGDYAKARAALESSLKLLPGQLEARLLLGQTDLKLKDYAAAQDQLEAAALLDPQRADVQDLLAEAYRGAGKDELARQAAARAGRLRSRAPKR